MVKEEDENMVVTWDPASGPERSTIQIIRIQESTVHPVDIDFLREAARPLIEHTNVDALKANCTHELRRGGLFYPRTCEACGLGPCKFLRSQAK